MHSLALLFVLTAQVAAQGPHTLDANWRHLVVTEKPMHAPRLFEQAEVSPESDELAAVCSQNANDSNTFFVYYAAYGSNISLERMRAYFVGGRAKRAKKVQQGTVDKTAPHESTTMFLTGFPLFGEHRTSGWGEGSVVFLDTRPSGHSERREALVRLYRMTLAQFTDLFLQENDRRTGTPDARAQANLTKETICALASASRQNPDVGMQWPLGGWYPKIVVLAEHRGLPVVTFTCSDEKRALYLQEQEEGCNMPSRAYRHTIAHGLRECGQAETWAHRYIDQAACSHAATIPLHR